MPRGTQQLCWGGVLNECEWGFTLGCLADDAVDAQIITDYQESGSCICFTVAAEGWKIDNMIDERSQRVCLRRLACVCPLRGDFPTAHLRRDN